MNTTGIVVAMSPGAITDLTTTAELEPTVKVIPATEPTSRRARQGRFTAAKVKANTVQRDGKAYDTRQVDGRQVERTVPQSIGVQRAARTVNAAQLILAATLVGKDDKRHIAPNVFRPVSMVRIMQGSKTWEILPYTRDELTHLPHKDGVGEGIGTWARDKATLASLGRADRIERVGNQTIRLLADAGVIGDPDNIQRVIDLLVPVAWHVELVPVTRLGKPVYMRDAKGKLVFDGSGNKVPKIETVLVPMRHVGAECLEARDYPAIAWRYRLHNLTRLSIYLGWAPRADVAGYVEPLPVIFDRDATVLPSIGLAHRQFLLGPASNLHTGTGSPALVHAQTFKRSASNWTGWRYAMAHGYKVEVSRVSAKATESAPTVDLLATVPPALYAKYGPIIDRKLADLATTKALQDKGDRDRARENATFEAEKAMWVPIIAKRSKQAIAKRRASEHVAMIEKWDAASEKQWTDYVARLNGTVQRRAAHAAKARLAHVADVWAKVEKTGPEFRDVSAGYLTGPRKVERPKVAAKFDAKTWLAEYRASK